MHKRMRRKSGINQRTRAWTSMRILRRFCLPDIIATAEISPGNCAKYVRALRKAGYLRTVRARRSGKAGGGAVYQLVRNTGPHAPLVKDGFVYDQNTGETMDSQGWLCVRPEHGRNDGEQP